MPILLPSGSTDERAQRRIGMLSTYPPKLCGLATFTAALEAELVSAGDQVTIVAIADGTDGEKFSPRVRHQLRNGVPQSVRETAQVLSRSDVAIIQHEYGIFGGPDGDEVLDVMAALDVPSIVILHTVPAAPTPHQREVLEAVCDAASRFVVMTAAAGDRLAGLYSVDTSKMVVIPHGAAPTPPPVQREYLGIDARRTQLLTWGLLGPGKGIEHVIQAMSLLDDVRPRLRYTVAGATHPKVYARDGDAYRQSLMSIAAVRGVSTAVRFDDTYRDVPTLTRFVAGSSLVVLPYDSREQVTSGVLVDAIAAGRPVIATAFPHAIEMLSDGAGIVVPHQDPSALADAIRTAVTTPGLLDAMSRRARAIAPSLQWSAVAAQYQALADMLCFDAVASR